MFSVQCSESNYRLLETVQNVSLWRWRILRWLCTQRRGFVVVELSPDRDWGTESFTYVIKPLLKDDPGAVPKRQRHQRSGAYTETLPRCPGIIPDLVVSHSFFPDVAAVMSEPEKLAQSICGPDAHKQCVGHKWPA